MSLKIQGIGCPFDTNYSSCGKRKPKTFSWTKDTQEIQIYIDSSLIQGLNTPNHQKKFGWFCESRAVKYNLFNTIKNDYIKFKNSYSKIFTCDEDLIKLDPSFFIFNYAGSNLPWTPEEEYGVYSKNKKISFLSSKSTMTEGHRYRLNWAERLKNQVDLFGGAAGSKQIGITKAGDHYHHMKKTEALVDYCYSLTFENCKYDFYFTEKVTDCFANGVIPIYHGSDKIINIFDKNGIIFFTEDFDINKITEDYYYNNICSVKTNLEIVKTLQSADDMLLTNIERYI